MAQSKNTGATQDSDLLWYKDAVIYQLHIKSFFDADNDGIGDFAGLISKLDYIENLGVNTIWLLPFYPSPRLDDGYDIADYRRVHPDYGSIGDARNFIRAAHQRGLRIITELVVNHTSDQHPWFQRARQAKPGSAARNFYVWSDNDQAYSGTRIIFCDTEKSNWTWDPVAGAYFWHRFYSHQPDLNYDNPRVLKEVINVMRFWLDMGVDGLRLDAVPYLVEREGTNNENLPETHDVLKQIRAAMDASHPGRLLLAEANQWPEDAQEYFGSGDECHMSFHFPLMPRMYMAIAREDRFPITDIMRQTPEIPDSCQWAIFLRNHDELTLEMVTSNERDYLWNVYAADRRARINLGIRRRLSPLLERDRRRIELMNNLLLSMPGTPVIYYGDELGMGDNIHLGDRDGVRTPMQWAPDRNGGFSRADPESLPLPVLMGPLYGYEAVNAEAQQRDPHSLLNWTRRMLAKRQQTHTFGRGTLRFLFPGNRKILAYLREYEDTSLLCVSNLSNASQPVELDLSAFNGRVPIELLGGTPFPTIGELPYLLTLPPYGFYWFELSTSALPPTWHVTGPEQMPEYATLVLRGRTGYRLTDGSVRILSNEVLPLYLQHQRWFASDQRITAAQPAYVIPLPGLNEMFLSELDVTLPQGSARYFLPVALFWSETLPPLPQQYALARVRRGSEMGMLTDAFSVSEFATNLLEKLRAGTEISANSAAGPVIIKFQPEEALKTLELPDELTIDWFHGEQSNSSLTLGNTAILKLMRRIVSGIHPEAEMTRQLSRAGYTNSPTLLGEIIRLDEQGTPHTLALLHRHISNQGDAWTWTLAYLKRTLESAVLTGESRADYNEELLGYQAIAATIGRRLAQLHAVLALPCEDPAFAPQATTAAEARQWSKDIRAMLGAALKALAQHKHTLTPAAREQADELQEQRQALFAEIDKRADMAAGAVSIRIHGDLHLGQVLIAQNDVYLIDFEGEPVRPLSERRRKSSPWRDVAGLLRSFDYAAATSAQDVNRSVEEALLNQFKLSAGEAFLNAYRETARESAQPAEGSWNEEPRDTALLELALLEKAAYEICYETAHRPDWTPIPLAGLTQLAQRLLSGTASSSGLSSNEPS
ncbi:MAG TPA: maltose alpha-D-glucosyltransferase [Eoetvoesiella sp.]